MYASPPKKIDIYRYILDMKHYFRQILLQLSRGAFETPQTIPNNHISHRFVCLLSEIITLTKR